MHAALTRVVATLADHGPQLARDGADVTLTMCDPGPSATAPKIDAATIFAAPTVRSLLLGNVFSDPSVSPTQAQCIVDKTLEPLDSAQIVKVLAATSQDDPLFRQVMAGLDSFDAGCR